MKIVDDNEQSNEQKPEVKQDDIKFFEITDLPSKYKLYPEGTKILGRRLNVPEVKKLAELNQENFNFVINSVLEQAIKGIDVTDLKVQDKLYIIFWLRANTYKEPGYVTSFHCSNSACDKDTEYEFQLDQLEMVYLNENFNENLTLGKNNIKINFESILDIKEKVEVLKNFEGDLDEEDLDIASNINVINNNEMTLLQKYEFIREELDPQEYIKLTQYIKDNEFGFENEFDVKCKHCGGITPMGISFCRSFFIPKFKN